MSEPYRATEFIADFSAAICKVSSLPALEKTGEFYRESILRHGVRSLCAEIYSRRKLELSQPGDGGGEAA